MITNRSYAQQIASNRADAMRVLFRPIARFDNSLWVNKKENNINQKSKHLCYVPVLLNVPRFERPRGSLFCRMEDAIEQRTKLFKVTVGVGVK